MKAMPESYLSSLYPPASTGNTRQAWQQKFSAQTRNVDIALTTREGDRITLSAGAMSRQSTVVGVQNASLAALSQSGSAQGLSLEIQGDLNEQELTDLSRLLSNLSDIAEDFFSGNLNEALTGALTIGDLGSVKELEASFSHTSVLAGYLTAAHPMPDLADLADWEQTALLPSRTDTAGVRSGPSLTALLKGQWQQFLETLATRDDEATPGKKPLASEPQSASQTGQRMFDRARDTIADHPRLTPHITSVADLAISRALKDYRQYPLAGPWAREIGKAYADELAKWLAIT